MSCELVRINGESFLDGELAPSKMLEVQAHLEVCLSCREQLNFSTALRRTTRLVEPAEAPLSAEFEVRMRKVLEQEAARELELSASDAHGSVNATPLASRRWRKTLVRATPFLAAAAVLALWLRTGQQPAEPSSLSPLANTSDAPAEVPLIETASPTHPYVSNTDDLLDGMIDQLARPPSHQVTDARDVRQLGRDVGVLVGLPKSLERDYGAQLQGGSVARMKNNQVAAQLRYRTADGRNFTVYIYDPKRLPVHAALKPSRLFAEPVYIGQRRGYSIAASKQAGVGYAVAGDLNPKDSARLVRTIAYSR